MSSSAIGNIRIAYLLVDLPELLPAIETALIDWFQPPLNMVGCALLFANPEILAPEVLASGKGGMRNRVGEFIKRRDINAYRFWKDTGLSRPIAYRICADSEYPLGGDVLDKICKTYEIQPGKILYWVPKEVKA